MYVLYFFVAVIPAVVGLIIVALRGHGRARTIGMIGFAVAAGLGIVIQLISILLTRIVAATGASFDLVNSLWSVGVMILQVIQMIILAMAIIANRPAAPNQQLPPMSYGYNPPPTAH